MRGSPPVQLALLLLGFIVVGVPLVELTHGRTESTAAESTSPGETKRPVFFRIRCVTPPLKFSIKAGGEDLISSSAAPSPIMEGRKELAFSEERLELLISAEWPAGSPESVLTIEMEPDGWEGRSRFVWSLNNKVEDTVSFTWKP